MEIKVLCPSCKKQLKAPAQMAGKQAKCPHCQTLMLLPEVVHKAEEAAPPPPPASQPMSNLSSLLDEESEYRLASGPKVNSPFGASSSGDQPRRPCPMCGEMIAIGAAKCRYCQAIFDEGLRKSEKKRKKSRGYSDDDSTLSTGDWVIAILCNGIGCIMGIVYMIQGKPKGGKMLGISLLSGFVWTIIRVLIESMANQGGMGN
jgi:hypothetical protein